MAFTYWAGISLASVILLMIFHATHARWMVVLRRPLEAMAASVPIFVLLFIPLVIGMKHVYVWVDPPGSRWGGRRCTLLEHKARLPEPDGLRRPRRSFYFAVAIFARRRLFGWSTQAGRDAATSR